MEEIKNDELEQQETVETTEEEQVEETVEGSEEEQEQVEDQKTEEEPEAEQKEEEVEEKSEEETKEETEEKAEEGTEKEEEKEEEKVDISTEALVAKAKEINPEASEETYMEVLVGRLNKLEGYYTQSQEANSKLVESFEANPVVADILRDIIEGADVRVAIARHFSPEELIPQEGDPNFEEWQKSAEQRKKDIENLQKEREKLAENTEKSKEVIKVFAEKNKLSEEVTTQFLETLDKALSDLYSGVVSEDFLNKMLRAYNYNKDIEKAAKVGEVKGKNAKIEAKKKSEGLTGDEIPQIKTKAAIETEASRGLTPLQQLVQKEKDKIILGNV